MKAEHGNLLAVYYIGQDTPVCFLNIRVTVIQAASSSVRYTGAPSPFLVVPAPSSLLGLSLFRPCSLVVLPPM